MTAQLAIEWQERERVLDSLERCRVRLVCEARAVARELALAEGMVTSPEVLAELRRRGLGPDLNRVDARFMGPVFRGSEWERIGWLSGPQSPGSHSRPVAVWRLR